MTSLRARIAILLVVAIVGVVGLATLAVVSVVRAPTPEATIEPLARMIVLIAELATFDGPDKSDLGMHIRDRPANGRAEEDATQMLNEALRRSGSGLTAIVTTNDFETGAVASIQMPGNRWMILEIPDFLPPADRWLVLSGWVTLIALGATGVSLYFAAVLTRPLVMLEAAVARIGPDGVLVPLPEHGSGEVRATARALNHLSSRLKSAMESRMRLVAAAGHDLRTPMTRLRLRAEFLPDNEREKWVHDLDELDRIADSAIRLVREEANADAPDPIALDLAVGELVEELTSVGMKVELGSLDKVEIRAGGLGLRRALRNLIVNAATHGRGCRVGVTAQSGKAVITIVDNGPGIPPELLDKAFEPFFRVDPSRRQSVPGAGLGLAIAKEIVERYGGEITLANQPGGGLMQTIVFCSAGSPS